ncbi:hypothetical protein NDU88_001111 [Pleurodeles waltl]|uniref:P-type domain-containing protein n=1 Tax=Pleurodeles waltl TaxID=8319 RepID=A0AAV7NJ55_PLEWA|nr:hypothetical protein NDU88_001111 [Pleurodeles waltl]
MASKRICGMILAFIAGLAFLEKGTATNIGAEVCAIEATKRIECGFPGIKKKECQNQNCCFDSRIPGAKWCFRPFEKVGKNSSRCTAINPKARTDCGYPGIGMEKCIERNCCFDSSIPNVNWCFYPLPIVHKGSFQCAAIDPEKRTDCGYLGIGKKECKKRNCCFDSSVPNVKYCFFPLSTACKDASECAAISPKQRTDCGYYGINADECKKRNCCYDSSIKGVNWCFYALDR